MTAGTPFKAAMAWAAPGDLGGLLLGGTAQAGTPAVPGGMTTLRLNTSRIDGGDPLFGEIESVAVLPYRASAGEMAAQLSRF